MRVFVTGATGLVGSHLVERLRGRGDEVIALVRASSDVAFLRGLGVEFVEGDLADPQERLARAMDGCDTVVHAAALIYGEHTPEAYARVNVEGTERVLRAAGAAGARRAVHVSSVAVYGVVARPVGEDAWLAHPVAAGNVYARSKRDAERAAWRVHGEGVVAVTTVRPGVVYGERDRLFTPILMRVLRLPLLPLPGGGGTTLPVVYAGNVAAGIMAALDREEAAGRAYALSGDDGLTARLLLERLGTAAGRRPRLVPVPGWPVRAAGALGDMLRPVLPAVASTGLKRAAWLALHDNPYETARARAELDWSAAQLPAAEALRRTGAWWRARAGGK